MLRLRIYLSGFIALSVLISGFFFASWSALPQTFIDSTNGIIDTLRKRECVLTVSVDNQPLAGKTVTVRQIRNHFGFGASLGKKWFLRTDSAQYGDAFRSYFDWATPENEMKWKVNEELDDYQDFQDADWLVDWCELHNIKVRGHSLFWNEKREWMPDWALELNQANFKTAMKRRIDGTMRHFKGRVAHWDIINEIVHGESGQPERPGLLVTLSGDTNVFAWIFKEARAIDSTVRMGVNEFSMIGQYSSAREYVTEIKSIESKGGQIDIVGLEGHFGGYLERSRYLERIDTFATALPNHELWLTEVDFEIDSALRADKMEELMRTCFAHRSVGGLVLWVWWEGNRWRPYNSFLVDSNFTENELGERWRTVRDEWKTTLTGTVNEADQFGFTGFHGQYSASVQLGDVVYSDTFDLEPGEGMQSIAVNLGSAVGVRQRKNMPLPSKMLYFNGQRVPCSLPSSEGRQLFVLTYSLSGQLISRKPLSFEKGSHHLNFAVSSGCRVVQIGTVDKVLYSRVGVGLK